MVTILDPQLADEIETEIHGSPLIDRTKIREIQRRFEDENNISPGS